MNKVNFDAKMQNLICGKKILLHSCCAPCSTTCLERLLPVSSVVVYYYNPNIDTYEEFTKRLGEQQRYCDKLSVTCITDGYEKTEFLTAVSGLENEKEGGKRCEKCFYLRLKKTALKAKSLGFDAFMTTLTLSPLKNSQLINDIGEKIGQEIGIYSIPISFKKRDGFMLSVKLSRDNDLYRQNYCGCEFSKR